MDKQNWRAVWEETRATMAYLEQSLEKVHELERAARFSSKRAPAQKVSQKPWP